MSLLRDVLKRGKPPPNTNEGGSLPLSSKRNIKSYASSIKSSGGASMRSLAESMFSFYSVVTGSGPRVPKRRRADFSRLGVPEWYSSDPPPAPAMPGTAPPSNLPPYTMAHSTVMHATDAGVEPWLSLVLYSHAPVTSPMPMYHNAGIVGEVRMVLAKPTNFSTIDVWFVSKSDSVVDTLKPAIFTMTACLWNRKQGDPRATEAGGAPFKGKFPAGSYVFPFQFPELPSDTLVKHPDEEKRKNKARVPLPPTYFLAMLGGFSGNIKHTVGVNVTREGLGTIDEEFGIDVQYLPLARVLPRLKTPTPYLPTREDWPFAREVVGGWTLTPFGGRGRLGEEIVEIEGIVRLLPPGRAISSSFLVQLGIQEPGVYTAGQTLEFSLMLWSSNPLALEALAQPGAIAVGYYQSDIFSLDALHPRNSARKNRKLTRLAEGRVWLTDVGRPAEDVPAPACKLVELPEPSGGPKSPGGTGSGAPASFRVKGAPASSRMQEVFVPDAEEEPTTDDAPTFTSDTAASTAVGPGEERAPSPVPSLEGLDDLPDSERVVRLDGEVRVPACTHPSFRYTSMAREYVLHLLITHPQYAHISPSGTGILAEVPVWYVLNRFGHLSAAEAQAQQTEAQRAALPVKGDELVVGDGAMRLLAKVGHVTTQKRPTSGVQRVAAF
ncbi:hypothetical protein FB451DRAFT_1432715 [Mycena latifolia]|nr:hypothetical protein FB451DRAFT_1432715 [Mycena latifolia]